MKLAIPFLVVCLVPPRPAHAQRVEVDVPGLARGRVSAVESRAVHEPRLVVFDAGTGVPLEGVSIHLESGRGTPLFVGERGLASVLRLGAASPVVIDDPGRRSQQGPVRCWVGAEGYGWRLVEVDTSAPGEMLVGLEPGGALEVEAASLEDRVVRVWRVGDGAAEPLAARAGSFRLEGVPAGEYVVEAAVPDAGGALHGVALGLRRVTVRPGANARASFGPAERAADGAAGSLAVRWRREPSVWSPAGPAPQPLLLPADPARAPLDAALQASLVEQPFAGGVLWTWSALPAGSYVVRAVRGGRELDPWYAAARAVPGWTPEVGAHRLEPRFTDLRVVAAETGEPVAGPVFRSLESEARPWRPRAWLGWPDHVPDVRVRGLVLRPGERWLIAAPGRLPAVVSERAEPDDAVDVALAPGAVLHLRFVDRGRRVALEALAPGGAPADAARFLRAWQTGANAFVMPHARGAPYEIVAAAPGRLRVDVTPPPGYLPVPRLEVDVDLGPPRELVVELERIPSLR